jgi:hypothetical protein
MNKNVPDTGKTQNISAETKTDIHDELHKYKVTPSNAFFLITNQMH